LAIVPDPLDGVGVTVAAVAVLAFFLDVLGVLALTLVVVGVPGDDVLLVLNEEAYIDAGAAIVVLDGSVTLFNLESKSS
jgi:hypothetical protein